MTSRWVVRDERCGTLHLLSERRDGLESPTTEGGDQSHGRRLRAGLRTLVSPDEFARRTEVKCWNGPKPSFGDIERGVDLRVGARQTALLLIEESFPNCEGSYRLPYRMLLTAGVERSVEPQKPGPQPTVAVSSVSTAKGIRPSTRVGEVPRRQLSRVGWSRVGGEAPSQTGNPKSTTPLAGSREANWTGCASQIVGFSPCFRSSLRDDLRDRSNESPVVRGDIRCA
jgi:hypothetical protein